MKRGGYEIQRTGGPALGGCQGKSHEVRVQETQRKPVQKAVGAGGEVGLRNPPKWWATWGVVCRET